MFFYVTRIRDRRFVLVDPERGLAFAFAFFDNGSGDARNGTLADGRKVVVGPEHPVDVADCRGVQDRARADWSRGVGAPPGPLRHGIRMEHVGRGDVERAATEGSKTAATAAATRHTPRCSGCLRR